MPLTSVELKGLQTFAHNVSVLTSGEVRFRLIAFNSRKTLFDKLENVSDGVNIAARLEALSQPNGISISKRKYAI